MRAPNHVARVTLCLSLLYPHLPAAASAQDAVPRLAGALLGDTPMVDDLRSLTDRIGGRPAGSPANLRAVEWALERFRAAGVPSTKETFRMPGLWRERSAGAVVQGRDVEFAPAVAAMPYSTGTSPGLTARLVDGGQGRQEDYRALGSAQRRHLLPSQNQPDVLAAQDSVQGRS